jgi:hypothetical protein
MEMNGFIKKAVAGSCLSLSLGMLVGCDHYRDIVDPCWMERYDSMAKHSVNDMLNVQADRGHMLEQTIWNWHFETDPKTGAATDHLNAAGFAVLQRIARTLPAPDGQLFVQNAQDIPLAKDVPPETLLAQRDQLNRRRIDAVHRFLSTQVITHPGMNYQVAVHDFLPTGVPSHWTPLALEQIEKNIKTGTPQAIVPPTYATK